MSKRDDNRQSFVRLVLLCAVGWSSAARADDGKSPPVSFEKREDCVEIAVGGQPFATYVFRDEKILRPYFAHVRAPSGRQVTRNHPPVTGKDAADHDTMHPGLWLAFGDLGGSDFWRNKGHVRHDRFTEEPRGEPGRGSFAVRNVYESGDRAICTEDCRLTVSVLPAGRLLLWDSTFRAGEKEFAFGDQEEMGLGVRVATSLSVVKGGKILNSDGLKNEKEVWGKPAKWCAYESVIEGERTGLLLMPAPQNFRKSWFHARDYGLLVANPFGQRAFTKGDASRVAVKPGAELRLQFGVLIFSVAADREEDYQADYSGFVKIVAP